MLNTIEYFLYHHYIAVYCSINIAFFIVTLFYRKKYFDETTKKYKKSVEDDMVANILLAAIKMSISVAVILLAVVALIFKIVDRSFVMGKHRKLHTLLSAIMYLSVAISLYFPIVVFSSFFGLFGKYDADEIEYLYKK